MKKYSGSAGMILLFLFSFSIHRTFLFACDVPSGITASAITTSSAALSWSAVAGAANYRVQYRVQGATSWVIVSTPANSITLHDLQIGTVFETSIRSICSADSSEFSATQTFETLLPTPDHVVICIMENHAYGQIIDSSFAPYLHSLAIDTGSVLFTQSYAIEHPSQPNYLDLFSGSNQGVIKNECLSASFTTDNLGSQLITAGNSYATYAEGLPSVGFNGCKSDRYVRKHNPSANWMGSDTNQIPATTNQPFTAFPSDYSTLPTVSFVIPDLDHDMHDGTVNDGDIWLQANLDSYIQWAKTHNSLFILTFDEDDGPNENHITTIFTGAMMKHGNDSTVITHFNVLRTMEDMYSLPYAGSAATSANISGCWKTQPVVCSYTGAPAKPGSIMGSPTNVCGDIAYPFSCPTVINATSYNWTLPAGAIINSGQGTTSISASMPAGFGNGKISVNASNCYAASSDKSLTLYGIPKKPGTITGPPSVCANQTGVQYSIAGVKGASSYNWLVPADATITEGQGTTAIIVNCGTGGGKVKVLSGSSCGSSAYKSLKVSITCRESEGSITPFNIYPNPAADAFHLQIHSDIGGEMMVSIKDVSGRLLDQFQNLNAGTFFFGKDFPAGVYFVDVLSSTGERWAMKVVKEE